MVVSTLSCEFCGVLVVSFWGFWKHQPSQFPSLMPHSRKSSLHVPGWLLQTLVGWRGSCGSEHRCLREGVGPNCLWVKQRVEGVQFSYFLKDGLVFSDWKMMGCWLCIVFIYIYLYVVLDWFNVHPEDLAEIYLADKGLCFRWVVQPPPHIRLFFWRELEVAVTQWRFCLVDPPSKMIWTSFREMEVRWG